MCIRDSISTAPKANKATFTLMYLRPCAKKISAAALTAMIKPKANIIFFKLIGFYYSTEMRKAAAVASGASTTAKSEIAANKDKCACGLIPCWLADTASEPNISTGIYSGNTNNATNKPLPRAPKVSAAPIAPIRLSAGVPSKSETTKMPIASLGNAYCKPIIGASNTTGKPHTSQCAKILADTNNDKG